MPFHRGACAATARRVAYACCSDASAHFPSGCRQLLPGTAVAAPPIVPSRTLTATITPIHRMTILPRHSAVTRCQARCPAVGPPRQQSRGDPHVQRVLLHCRHYHPLGGILTLLYCPDRPSGRFGIKIVRVAA